MLVAMGFSFASVLLSYFLIAGGTFFTLLIAGRIGVHSEYLGYIILAIGGALGGMVAARASKGSTIIEPAIGAVLLIASFIAVGVVASGADSHLLLLQPAMKGIALTSAACGGGGIAGAFVAEKLFGNEKAGSGSWILYVMLAGFGAGVVGTIFGGALGKGESGTLLGVLALCCLIVGLAAGASATTRPLGASFLGGTLGVGAFLVLAIYVFVSVLSSHAEGAAAIPSEVYIGMAIMAVGAGIVTLIGALIGWATVGRKQSGT
jgi:hypothetical protein